MSANQIVNQTSQELVTLAATARLTGDRMSHLQVDRLKLEFEKSLQRYSALQKVKLFLFHQGITVVDGKDANNID